MKWGFENQKFYIDYTSCSRPFGNIYEEFDKRAVEIAEQSKGDILVSISSGIDSQAMLLSFLKQNIPVTPVFMYLPGYNETEFRNLKIISERFKVKPEIINIDPYEIKQELLEETEKFDIQTKSLLHKKFFSMLPLHSDIVYIDYNPYIHIDTEKDWSCHWYQGFNSTEITREKSIKLLIREGNIFSFSNTSEIMASMLTEELLWSLINSWRYYHGNKVTRSVGPKLRLNTTDRWDFYLKPFIYGKYWKDEIIYFPKTSSFENIPYLNTKPLYMKEHAVLIPLKELIEFYSSCTAEKRRYYENCNELGGNFN